MRLLITTDTVGGVWTFTQGLTEELLRRGHAVALVSFGRAPLPSQTAWVQAQHKSFAEQFRFTSTEIALEWMQDNDGVLREGEPVLASVAAAFQPDLLLSNQFCYGAAELPLPRIVVAHSDVLSWARACNPAALQATPWLNRYTSLVQRGLLQANLLVSPSLWMLRALAQSFLIPAATAVIPNGMRTPANEVARERRLQAVSAGRLWDEGKGLDMLSEIAVPFPVLIAGELESAEAGASRTVPAGITALGPLPHPELLELLRESAIYVCSSRYEPFGLAPLEAALCGCALLLRDLPSLREVWGDAAIYFSNGPDLEAKLRQFAADPNSLAAAQSRANEHARRYSVERMTDAYLKAFEETLKAPRVTADA